MSVSVGVCLCCFFFLLLSGCGFCLHDGMCVIFFFFCISCVCVCYFLQCPDALCEPGPVCVFVCVCLLVFIGSQWVEYSS